MNEIHDPLWNPQQPGDDGLRRLEQLLAPYSAQARGLQQQIPHTPVQTPRPRRLRRVLIASAAALAASVLLGVYLGWRFNWQDGQAWTVHGGAVTTAAIEPGEWLRTGSDQQLAIDVARIGRVVLSADSSLSLIETRRGFHRMRLEQGHLRARIWAPPGWFGISSGAAELIDLGCDFDLWKQEDGGGRVLVRTGWISYAIGSQQVLVPAGYQMRFEADRAYTPLRPEADKSFREAVAALDESLHRAGPQASAVDRLATNMAERASDDDGFTLLSVLSRYPQLARTALYPRLMRSQKLAASEQHRKDWIAGDIDAINQGWSQLPRQPKAWWWNWADWF